MTYALPVEALAWLATEVSVPPAVAVALSIGLWC